MPARTDPHIDPLIARPPRAMVPPPGRPRGRVAVPLGGPLERPPRKDAAHGGAADRVPAYASSGLWLDCTADELVSEARRFLAQGHRALKMRLGRSPREDLEGCARVAAALTVPVATGESD